MMLEKYEDIIKKLKDLVEDSNAKPPEVNQKVSEEEYSFFMKLKLFII